MLRKRMDPLWVTTLVLVLGITIPAQGQQNGVKPLLIPCYNVSALPGIIIANNRPPTTLNIFLELLRRLEDANPTLTVRDFSALILQRLRQNGIIITSGRSTDLSIGIPFSPWGLEAIKGTLILQHYLTNSTQTLSYGDLEQADLCSFHYMISNTMNTTIRGDEASTCARAARYQSRMIRDVEDSENTPDTENGNTDEDGDTEQVENVNPRHLSKNALTDSSQCPVELGLVYTNHGAVKIGQVLAGLAAGYNQETVQGTDNRYDATLGGDLAHTALAQAQIPLNIGFSGGWNSTVNPKYFFLDRNTDLDYFTDQDIRGSVDGLLLALQLENLRRSYSDVKLSQIIDMFYSPDQRGVFDSTFRACNRNILYSEYISIEQLTNQVNSFIAPLDDFGQYPTTISNAFYTRLVESAINNFTSYFPRINDLACPQLDSPSERVKSDLMIFLDPSWTYTTVQPILSYILDNIDVNKYGSRYALYSGSDARNITNNTIHLLDFHKSYNLSIHETLTREYDYSKIYEVVESTVRSKLNNNSYTGGESTIVLLVTRSTPNENQRNFLQQRKEIMRQFMPDVTVLVLGSGTSADYSSILSNESRDFIFLSESTNDNDLKSTAQNVIDRIKNIPRSIVNPNCGSGFGGSASSFTLTQYVDLNSINYYRIAPNYFFSGGEGSKNIKITETSTGSITVCTSRDQSRPNNQTSQCTTLQSGVQTIDVAGWCGDSVQNCAPIYLSVYGNTTQYRCRDYFCRFPDSMKYTISLENVGCASSAFTMVANFLFVTALVSVRLYF